MFCRNCGFQNEEGAAFCQNCGSPLDAPVNETAPETPVEQPVEQPVTEQPAQPVYTAPAYTAPPYAAPAPVNPVIAAMKKVFSSPAFIIVVFANFAAAIVQFISSLSPRVSLKLTTDSEVRYLHFGGEGVGYGIGVLISMLISTLIYFLILQPALKKKDNSYPTAGFTVLKVFAIIGLVGVCIAGAAVIAAFGILAFVKEQFVNDAFTHVGDAEFTAEMKKLFTSFNEYGLAARIITAVILVAMFVFIIVYIAKYIKTLNTFKRVASTGVPSDRVSPFVAVVLFISAAYAVGFSVFLFIYGVILYGIVTALSAASLICLGVTVFKFRNAMREQMAKAAAPAGVPYGAAVCPRCGVTYPAEAPACPNCGLPRM